MLVKFIITILTHFSWIVILPSLIFSLVVLGISVRLVLRTLKNKPQTGFEGMLGEKGEAASTINENGGTVFINGEIWKAVSDNDIPRFSKIYVESIDHLILSVKKS